MITHFRHATLGQSVAASIAAVILLALIQAPLNSAWARRKNGAPQQPGTSAGERGLGVSAASRSYALVIGNNAYRQLPKLQTAENDAREVEKLLRENYGFRTKLLLNATRQQIVGALGAYRRDLGPEDKLLIYYAGHGYNDVDAGRAYWLPVDSSREDNSNWISADDITAGTKVIPARHVLVISDSCYSGTLTRGIGEMLPRPSDRDQFLRKMSAGRSRTLMASGGNEPVADGGGGRHSVFANALLRGLREMSKDTGKDQFTAAELFRGYIEERVAGSAQQTPEYNPLRNSGHESGDFVFARVSQRDKSASALPGAQITGPKEERPSTLNSQAPANLPTPADTRDERTVEERDPNDLTGTTWTGTDPVIIDGKYTIEFLKGGQLRYSFGQLSNGAMRRAEVKGEWTQAENVVHIILGHGTSTWQGKIEGPVISGTLRYADGSKEFTLLKKKTP